MYQLERLKKEDLPSYKALIDEAFDSSNPIEFYERYRENAAYRIYVVKEAGEIIGSVTQVEIPLFTFSFQPCLELFNVAVRRSHQKKGVGSFLLRETIARAKEEGYRSISLTCLESALPAHKLYESAGFHKAASRKYAIYF
ncbi:MAG: GNAT family N-acetyltransferase [Clostridia bacterium]|jgi:ribosomal-protein-alanine N-acetyltransferase|nr:GNAT family N-acetyltransferase [Clostridia bacterium]